MPKFQFDLRMKKNMQRNSKCASTRTHDICVQGCGSKIPCSSKFLLSLKNNENQKSCSKETKRKKRKTKNWQYKIRHSRIPSETNKQTNKKNENFPPFFFSVSMMLMFR